MPPEIRLLFILFLLLFNPYLCAKEVVKTCLDYTPYNEDFDGNKTWNGRNIETLFVTIQRLDLELDMSMRAPFARCLRLLEQGRIDVIAGLIFTEERKQKFVMVPYSLKNRLAIFYRKNRSVPLDADQLTSQDIIGVQLAFALPDNIRNSSLMEHVAPVPSVDAGLNMVLNHRIAGVISGVNNGNQIISEVAEYRDQFDFILLDNQGNKSVHFAISPKSTLVARLHQIQNIVSAIAIDPAYAHLEL